MVYEVNFPFGHGWGRWWESASRGTHSNRRTVSATNSSRCCRTTCTLGVNGTANFFLFGSRKLCAKAFNKPAYWGCSSFPNMALMTALKVWRPWMNGTSEPGIKEVSSKHHVGILNIEWAVDTTAKHPWRRKTTVDRCSCRKVRTSICRWKRSATDCAAPS